MLIHFKQKAGPYMVGGTSRDHPSITLHYSYYSYIQTQMRAHWFTQKIQRGIYGSSNEACRAANENVIIMRTTNDQKALSRRTPFYVLEGKTSKIYIISPKMVLSAKKSKGVKTQIGQ